jgi:hypothetical protein
LSKLTDKESIFKALGLTPPRKMTGKQSWASPAVSVVCLSDASPGSVAEVEAAQQAEPQAAAGKAHPATKRYLDSYHLAMAEINPDSSLKLAEMRPGPEGFCEFRFGSEPWGSCELPNIMLSLPLKRPASSSALKRPAAKQKGRSSSAAAPQALLAAEDEEEEEEEQADEACETPEVDFVEPLTELPNKNVQYLQMYYKASQAYAFRVKGGRQVFQIVNRAAKQDSVAKLAGEVLQRLNAGDNLLKVQVWAKEAVKKL